MLHHIIMLGLIDGAGALPVIDSPPISGIGGYGMSSMPKLKKDDEDRLSRALEALEGNVKRARTPRVRQAKLSQAVIAAEEALAIISREFPQPVIADLSEVHRLLIDVKAGFIAFPDWRLQIMDLIQGIMLAASIEDDEEDAFIMMMLA